MVLSAFWCIHWFSDMRDSYRDSTGSIGTNRDCLWTSMMSLGWLPIRIRPSGTNSLDMAACALDRYNGYVLLVIR